MNVGVPVGVPEMTGVLFSDVQSLLEVRGWFRSVLSLRCPHQVERLAGGCLPCLPHEQTLHLSQGDCRNCVVTSGFGGDSGAGLRPGVVPRPPSCPARGVPAAWLWGSGA